MKKILTLGIVLAISTGMSFAASTYGNALKNAIKQDIETTIHFLQLQGDTDAMDVALKRERIEYIARMKEDLFGL